MIKKFTPIVTLIITSLFLSACNLSIPSKTQNAAPEEEKTVSQAGEETFSGSVLDLLSQNKNATCTWSYTDPEDQQTNTGTVYISGKKFRQEISMDTAEEEKINISTISDGDFVYMWNSSQPGQGIKMKLDLEQTDGEEDTKIDTPTDVQSSVELEKKFDYHCSAWVVDNSKFNLPEGVQFMDLAETMNQLPTISESEE